MDSAAAVGAEPSAIESASIGRGESGEAEGRDRGVPCTLSSNAVRRAVSAATSEAEGDIIAAAAAEEDEEEEEAESDDGI